MSDPLLPENDFSAAPECPPQPVFRVVGETGPASLLPQADLPVTASDPLQAVRLMSEEEKIALCS
jgi:hypothetical protein